MAFRHWRPGKPDLGAMVVTGEAPHGIARVMQKLSQLVVPDPQAAS